MAEKKVTASKKPVAKKTVKTEKKAATVPAKAEAVKERSHGDVKVDVYSAAGKADGTMTLPEVLFAAKVNKPLMAQAVRVYLANQREGSASTKTRGEVEGSTRKIYKQKGTGRARHGAIRAPIFVKGGIALGPRPRDYSLDLSKKMKKAAVASAFTSQLMANSVKVFGELTSLELKTKVFNSLFETVGINRKTLVLLSKQEKSVTKAMRNLSYIDVMTATDANTYQVLNHKHVVLTKEAVKELETLYK